MIREKNLPELRSLASWSWRVLPKHVRWRNEKSRFRQRRLYIESKSPLLLDHIFHLRIIVAVIPAELLLEGYCCGVFPMAMRTGELAWFSPDPRAVIPLDDGFRVPHGLRRTLKKGWFEIRLNTCFERVMRACARREETWINDEIIESFCELHRLGFAHSVETWQDGELAGGLYGVALGGAFFGESMFHTRTDASKIALHALVERLRERGFTLLDTQWLTSHLMTFGAVEIPRFEYLARLRRSVGQRCKFL